MHPRRFAAAGVTATAVLLLLALPATLSAQSYADQVWNQLRRIYTTANNDGYSTRNYVVGRLNDDAEENWTFTLNSGTSYRLAGVCDNDCRDLDIILMDDNGSELVKDTSADDFPIVHFTPRTTGRYRVKVRMYTCEANPCYFGFGIFAK